MPIADCRADLRSHTRTAAVVPIKLNNQRLPNKNIKPFTNGKPLCHYLLSTLLEVGGIDEVYVYCSRPEIQEYIPAGVKFLQRPESLDSSATRGNDLLKSFTERVSADIYVMAHITSPFVSRGSIEKGLEAVKSGEYDSAFAAKRFQDFLWQDNAPLNYKLDDIPRTQDLPLMFQELTGFYICRRNVIADLNRRIGDHPFIVETGEIESIDIDEPEDFTIADAVFNHVMLRNSRGGGLGSYTLDPITCPFGMEEAA